ncbi:MAG TPA: 50S ribosomal protein L11 methyltransferase [Gemmatimonadaceae bacterium]|nr:50S ribosomal protein L11 methyltransferase [Gemmatimonadaceae bacterium]
MTEPAAWVTVRVVPGTGRDRVAAALFDAGAQGLQEVGEALVTHVPDQSRADALVCAALAASPDAHVETSPLDAVDWTEKWKDSIRVHELGRLTIAPPWLADGRDPARTIVIEPEMAFGTGEHATTRGVIRLMQSVIRDSDRVADLGAGSAVLSIAAAKLGARHVAAIEIDHDAIANAEENVRRNGVTDRVTVIEGDAAVLLPLVAPVRVITVNIISSVLLALLPAIESALQPGGRAILSGILSSERDEMIRALEQHGWVVAAEDEEEAWWSAAIARR